MNPSSTTTTAQWRNGDGRIIETPRGSPVTPQRFAVPAGHYLRLLTPMIIKAKKRSLNNRTLNPGVRGEALPAFFSAPEAARHRDLTLLCCTRWKRGHGADPGLNACRFCQPGPSLISRSLPDPPDGEGTEPPRKRQRRGAAAAVTAAPAPVELEPATVPRLTVLAMLRVMVHCRRPSQFERQLPLDLARRVWQHLPLRFLSEQQLARSYAPGCGCPTQVWMNGPQVVLVSKTLCLTCLGLGRELRKHDAPPRIPWICPSCHGPHGRCGCPKMPHAKIDLHYDEAGNRTRIKLYLNRATWGHVGSCNLVGQGCLHGYIPWKPPPHAWMRGSLPPALRFHHGLRISGQVTEYRLPNRQVLHTFAPTIPGPQIAGLGPKSPAQVTYVKETPLSALSTKKIQRHTGSHLFELLERHLGQSRTVAVFRKAAKQYMRTGLSEDVWLRHHGASRAFFYPTYRQEIGSDYPC